MTDPAPAAAAAASDPRRPPLRTPSFFPNSKREAIAIEAIITQLLLSHISPEPEPSSSSCSTKAVRFGELGQTLNVEEDEVGLESRGEE